MGAFADMWKDVDTKLNAIKREYAETAAAIKACKGWRFGGCPDGLMWVARHNKHGEIKERKSADLIRVVQAHHEDDMREASGPTATR